MSHSKSLTVLGGALLLSYSLATLAAPTANNRVYEPGEGPFDQSYANWTTRWLQHMLSIPADINPIADETGADCGIGQSGKVWYLAGNFFDPTPTHRRCSVPEGTSLLLSLDNVWFVITQTDIDNNHGVPPTIAYITAVVRDVVDTIFTQNLRLTIDGLPVTGLARYRFSTGPFAFWNPDAARSISGATSFQGTNYPAVGEGYYVMLKPLSVGHHHVVMAVDDGPGLVMNVSYDLTIVKSR
jgi:hypothetical protein